MFTVKATYRNETRRFTFPESVLFPTYKELHNQVRDLIACHQPALTLTLALSSFSHKP
ncbi:hypothetical protein J3R82DRAFT_542 [Butyriboletus roseoflavus]|nr:hypothetical protein J3R82DRAFT_542 [Butyriboletus roseoflavus]